MYLYRLVEYPDPLRRGINDEEGLNRVKRWGKGKGRRVRQDKEQ